VPSVSMKRDVLSVIDSEEGYDFDIAKFSSSAKIVTNQVRSCVINKKGILFARQRERNNKLRREDCMAMGLEVEKLQWSKENLENLERVVTKNVHKYLLKDFVEPKASIPNSFPNHWSLVAMVYYPGNVDATDGKSTWSAVRNTIRASVEQHFGPKEVDPGFDDRNSAFVEKCLDSIQRVFSFFEKELRDPMDVMYHVHVGEWMVLSYSLISAFNRIPDLEHLADLMKDWSLRLFDQAVGDPSNLCESTIDFSEVLFARWAVQKLGGRVPKDVDRILAKKARDELVSDQSGSEDYDLTVKMIWGMFTNDLGFPCGARQGSDVFQESLQAFEDSFEERYHDLVWDKSFKICPQSASNIWTFGFWVTHYALVKCKYSFAYLKVNKSLGGRLAEMCFSMACMEANRRTPDLLGELVHALLLASPQSHMDAMNFVMDLLRLEKDGKLPVENELAFERQVLHARFVYLLALATFVIVHRDQTEDE
jgi:hypothetical protein